jgi:hypothetical protein
MKRYASHRRFAILLISAWAVPLAYAFTPGQATGRYQQPMRSSCTAVCGAGVRSSVIGVYGGTVVDQLSSGAIVLVKWPNGSMHETWTTRSHGYRLPVNPATKAAHIFFLWPES